MARTAATRDRPSRVPVGRVLAVVAVLGMTTFWIWALSGAPAKAHPDLLRDRAWVKRTSAECQRTMRAIEDLVPAREARTPAERAMTIDTATVLLVGMVDRLRDDRVGFSADRRVVKLWLDDWEQLDEARLEYAAQLREYDPEVDPDEPRFLVPLDDEGPNDGIDKSITAFAEVNEMPACASPGDVG